MLSPTLEWNGNRRVVNRARKVNNNRARKTSLNEGKREVDLLKWCMKNDYSLVVVLFKCMAMITTKSGKTEKTSLANNSKKKK